MHITRQFVVLSAALIITGSLGGAASAQMAAKTSKEHFIATAVDLGGATGRFVTNQVDIVINRWTPDAERDRLMVVLRDKGAGDLLTALQKEPVIGRISTPGSLSYDLRYARQMPGDDGGRTIVLATDRPIGLWEARNGGRSLDYPFTLIELRVDKDGNGEGKLQIAVKPSLKDNVLTLEDYAALPVMLKTVHAEK